MIPLPAIIAALHLPDPAADRSMAFLENYVAVNAAVFADAGVPALMLQDQTREPGAATPATVARVAALARMLRAAHPGVRLGILVQAHDAVAPLAIAHAAGAEFVRLKVFVAASMTAEGPRHALAVTAVQARRAMGAGGVSILADVFDRTSVPMTAVPPAQAARWAEAQGADRLVLTGDSFADSLARVRDARAAGVRAPILVGGGVDETNVADALATADGAIVSTSLMRPGAAPDDLLRWDPDRTRRFMDRVRAAT